MEKRIRQLETAVREQERTIAALEAQKARLFALMDGVPAYIYLQGADHTIHFANQSFRDQFGEPGGRPCYEVMADRRERCPRCRPFEVFETGRPIRWEWIRPDGKSYEVHDYPFTDVDGTRFVLELGMDITERKKQQREKAEIEGQLIQVQKLEALAALSGGLVHNFNNVLMGIQGEASIMLLHLDRKHPHYENLRTIQDLVRSAAGLVDQLLGFARATADQVEPTDMNRLIETTSRVFGQTRGDINIHKALQDSLPPANVDYGELEQVLLNLLVNASDAMPGGGDLFIRTEQVELSESDVKPYHVEPGLYVSISVRDTGMGMDVETQSRVFDPFFTTKSDTQGTGLGLSSAHGIVTKYGGIIKVHSRKDEGATFTLFLPVWEDNAALPTEETSDETS
jgi:signal transduction histidine kinase